MPDSLHAPLVFAPIFMERIWGGRHLKTLYDKPLPPGVCIGESWEIVDRPEAQSIVAAGPWRGRTLHELWLEDRHAVFGAMPDGPRFPLLIKLLDAQAKLSLQVHPPPAIAAELGGEPKAEFWHITHATPGAEIYVGLKKETSRSRVRSALDRGSVAEHVHRLRVRAGDSMFLPAGRMHAIGAGIVIVEIQQNSDTTYRVFDWNRRGAEGKPRTLHLEESMRSIDFEDREPELAKATGELLLNDPLFRIEKWPLVSPRAASPPGTCAIVGCLTGRVQCAAATIAPGEFFIVPASLDDRMLRAADENTALLRITVPA